MTTVLVTGATGSVGSSLISEMQGADASIRAFVRDPAKAIEKLGDEVELAVGDFADPGSVKRAMEGADIVFLSSGDSPDKVQHEVTVIDAAASAGVKRIVKASTVRADPGSPLPPLRWHGMIEEHLRRSGVPAVILASNFYMTNMLASAEQVRQGGIYAPAGDGRVSMIDPRDVGAVAAAVLTTEGHDGQTYTLTGPEAITFGQIAEELTTATGRPVTFVNVPDEVARQGLEASGMPDWLVDHLSKLFGLIRADTLRDTTDTVYQLIGRKPRTFAEFARDYSASFGG